MTSSSTEFKPLATLKGRRTKRSFKFFWNTRNHCVYIEQGFFSKSKDKTNIVASSWEMAYHAAEAYVFDR